MPMPSVDPTPGDCASGDHALNHRVAADTAPAGATQERPRVSRRSFFTAGASVAAASLVGSPAGAQQGTTPAPKQDALRNMVRRLIQQPPAPKFDPFGKSGGTLNAVGWDSPLSRLVRHITLGTTPEEMALARKLGYYGYLNYHLSPSRIDDTTAQNYVAQNCPLLTQDANQLYAQDQRMVQDQLLLSTMYRAVWSKRQLYERMVEFWTDHFSIYYPKVTYLKAVDDRDVIRRHALGKFPDMLKASATSPAMLEYLDNTRNRRPNVNQNYAREIMELHTLGVDGGYTQQDVAELSRVLSGWTMAPRGAGFVFDPAGHDYGAKTVMGVSIPATTQAAVGAAAKAEGDQLIDMLLNHTSTAKYIARKMLRHLLRYDPSDQQVAQIAGVYTQTRGDIPSMVRAVLSPANVTAATPKFRRPFGFVVAALRATNPTPVRLLQVTTRWMPIVGQTLFGFETPDGYPDKVEYWAGGALQRWNFANYLMTNTADVPVDFNQFIRVNTPDGLVDSISTLLFGGEIPSPLKTQLLSYAKNGTFNTTRAKETVALALGSSTFQWI